MSTARRLLLVPAAAVLATVAFASGGVATATGPTATPTPTPTGPDTTTRTKATWSVQPSTASGPTTRTSFDYTVVPGTDLVDYVGVNNYSNKPLALQVYATDAFNTPTGGTDVLAGSKAPADVGAWLKFPKRAVVVKANSRVDLPFRIDVPANATPGDHVGAVVASLQTVTSDGKGRDVTVDRRVGARINLRVEGTLEPVLTVTNLRTSYAASVNPLGGTLTLTYDVANTGNVQLAAHQKVAVKAFGIVGVKSTTLPDLERILPGNTVTRTEVVDGVVAGGLLSTSLTVEPFAASDDLGTTPAASTVTDSTVAISWFLLGAIVLLALGVWALRRTRRRRTARVAAEFSAAVEAARAEARAELAADARTTHAVHAPGLGSEDPPPAS